MAFDFSGKKVLVTGAGRGIGRGIALALAKAGCKVYALDCVQENVDKLASEESNIVAMCQDLSDWEATRVTLEGLEVLDGLVNNAAIVAGLKPALDFTREELEANLAVNLLATINCSQVVAKKMVAAGSKGSIVNLSSLLGHMAFPNSFSYNVSKAGVDMVTKQFALELGPHNIRLNSVNPSLVDTKIVDDATKSSAANRVIERQPIARVLSIEEVVGPVLYLLSDYSAMVTGTTQVIDGGLACNITTKT